LSTFFRKLKFPAWGERLFRGFAFVEKIPLVSFLMFRAPDFSVKIGEKQVWRHAEEGAWAKKYSRLRTVTKTGVCTAGDAQKNP
jgi:hypothetical protein